ncbi:MAG TPA: hypothetical protein VF618_00530 [Thermoanaerobaculia bacterium]
MVRWFLVAVCVLVFAADARAQARLQGRYAVTLRGTTPSDTFRVAATLHVVPCANRETIVPGGRHPLDVAIITHASAASSGVRGALWFATNSKLTSHVGGAPHLVAAAVHVCRVTATPTTITIHLDPAYALGNPLNVMTTTAGPQAIGKRILSGTVTLRFARDGTVEGTVSFSDNPYASGLEAPYNATLTGTRL